MVVVVRVRVCIRHHCVCLGQGHQWAAVSEPNAGAQLSESRHGSREAASILMLGTHLVPGMCLQERKEIIADGRGCCGMDPPPPSGHRRWHGRDGKGQKQL